MRVVWITPTLTVKEVAGILKVDYQTVRRWCRSGEIEASVIGGSYKITISSLEAYCQKKGLQIIQEEEKGLAVQSSEPTSSIGSPNVLTKEVVNSGT